jgi:hypothetical protein
VASAHVGVRSSTERSECSRATGSVIDLSSMLAWFV